jgi:general stress protein 26
MNEKTMTKTQEIIEGLAGQDNGFCTIALIDEQGYPTASTVSIIKADGMKQLMFGVSVDDNKARRAKACSRASVCINSGDYNITLVGTAEILTDTASKEDLWQPWFSEIWAGGVTDPDFCVLRFSTQRYNLWLGEDIVAGVIESEG